MGALSPVEAAAQNSLGKYTLIEKLGEGYLGPVYRGFDQDLGMPVVVRILCDGIRWDAKLEEAFHRECCAVAELKHPNIARIYEVGREGQSRYIAMESLGSGTLQNLIAQNSAVPVETKLSVMIQVAEGLSYAHKKGILHRDLGPGKIHLTPDGNVKIRDFAIANVLMKHLPHPAVRFGTPIYLCPEQIQHTDCDERADIFSAGTIFYELITHFHPFHDRDSNKALDNILSDAQIPTFDKFPDAPPGVWMILKSCLARHPENRFRNSDDLVNACRELLKSIREDTQLMLGELYASLSPLRKAVAQPNASAKTRALLDEIEKLLQGIKETEYSSLDRLMTMLMEQYPVIQSASSELPALSSICPQIPSEETEKPGVASRHSSAKPELDFKDSPAPDPAARTLSPPIPKEPPPAHGKTNGSPIPADSPHLESMTEEAPVALSQNGTGLSLKIGVPQQITTPGNGAFPSRCEPENGTAAAQTNGAADISSIPVAVEASSNNQASPVTTAIEGSAASEAVYVRPPSRYRRIPRPSYRSAVILLSLLVLATSGYIVLRTDAPESFGRTVYMPVRNKILNVFAQASSRNADDSGNKATQDSQEKPGRNPAEVLVNKARALAAENRIDESRALLQRTLEKYPNYELAISTLAELEAAATQNSRSSPPLEESVSRISALINSGKLQIAKTEIDRLQRIYPNAPEISALRRKWQNAYSKQTQEQSLKEEEQQKASLRQKEEEWNRQTTDSLARGNYTEASGVLSGWLAQNPGNGHAQDLNAKIQDIQRQLRTYGSAMAENRYPDALNALNNAEKLNPADPNLAEMRRQLESRKAAARAFLTIHRLGPKAALLLDGHPIGKDGEVEGESIPIGNHTLSLENGGVPFASKMLEYSEGQRVAFVYDLLKQNLRPMTEADRDLIARRRLMEEVARFTLEHDHGVFRGSCRGVLSLDALDIAYSPSSGSHGFRIPFKLLKLKLEGKAAGMYYITDNTHFQTFKFESEQAAYKFRQKWDELKALLR